MSLEEADMMDIGRHCAYPECHQLDFLPFLCSGCKQSFCQDHQTATAHRCPHAISGDNSAMVCPICAKAVKLYYLPNGAMEDPNVTLDRHLHSPECNPENYKTVNKKPKCPVKGCREKLNSINSIKCKDCGAAVCLKHRLAMDHGCPGPKKVTATSGMAAGLRAAIGGLFTPTNNIAANNGTTAKVNSSSQHRQTTASKIASAGRRAATSLQSQLDDYRASHRSKTGTNNARMNTTAPNRTASSSREVCTECGKSFADVTSLIAHAAEEHQHGWSSGSSMRTRPMNGGHIERCPHCAAEFDDPVQLVQHVEATHSDKVCVLC